MRKNFTLRKFLYSLTKKNNEALGFTLIELLVVFAVIATLSSMGLVAYSNYNDAQTLGTAASRLYDTLKSLEAKAQTQDKPSDCGATSLHYYEAIISNGGDSYDVQADCEASAITTFLPAGYIFTGSGTNTIKFYLLTGGMSYTNSTITIKNPSNGNTKTITLQGNGQITID